MAEELTNRVAELEKSVFKLTEYFKVAAFLAAFFGLAGIVFFVQLSKAKIEIKTLTKETNNVTKQFQEAKDALDKKAKLLITSLDTHAKKSVTIHLQKKLEELKIRENLQDKWIKQVYTAANDHRPDVHAHRGFQMDVMEFYKEVIKDLE